jgi:hypothetical protein
MHLPMLPLADLVKARQMAHSFVLKIGQDR